ncbi:MAG: Hsp20/alpha crystallin family protein [Betaproteobacteria bacterium]
METKKLAKLEPATELDVAFPFQMMRRMARDFDWFFDRFGRGRTFGLEPMPALWTPEIEVFERGNDLVVRADLPGLKKDEITVEMTEASIILKGERKREEEEKREGFYRSERSYGSFCRTIPMPEGAKLDQAKAVMRDGVLEVTVPVPKAEVKTKRLEIKEAAAGEKSKHAA